ncbi:MAG: hypothetical protein PUP91_03720 [Rhizonema sp. PD37]|nr:hypothetical protein [Rhizonema sp. PD37]
MLATNLLVLLLTQVVGYQKKECFSAKVLAIVHNDRSAVKHRTTTT